MHDDATYQQIDNAWTEIAAKAVGHVGTEQLFDAYPIDWAYEDAYAYYHDAVVPCLP